MADGPIWITEAEVTRLLSLKDALVALEHGLLLEGQQKAQNVPKTMGRWGDSVMHCLGAAMPEAGFAGWKTWVITKNGGAVTYELFDAQKGALLAVIGAVAMGLLRTAAMTGLGTKFLAPKDADTLALIGVGRQAMAQVAAIHAVRPLRRVLVFSRDAAKREAFAADLARQFGFDARPVDRIATAVGDAAITTLITRAEQPFLHAAMLPRGAHLNAVGAILSSHAEFADDVFARAGLIAVDSIADVKKNSREFTVHFGDGDWSGVRALGDVIAGGVQRGADVDLTLFKSVGMGISDLSMAVEVYKRAVNEGVGAALGAPSPSRIRYS